MGQNTVKLHEITGSPPEGGLKLRDGTRNRSILPNRNPGNHSQDSKCSGCGTPCPKTMASWFCFIFFIHYEMLWNDILQYFPSFYHVQKPMMPMMPMAATQLVVLTTLTSVTSASKSKATSLSAWSKSSAWSGGKPCRNEIHGESPGYVDLNSF